MNKEITPLSEKIKPPITYDALLVEIKEAVRLLKEEFDNPPIQFIKFHEEIIKTIDKVFGEELSNAPKEDKNGDRNTSNIGNGLK